MGHQDDYCIEVTRTDSGNYEIPGAATSEDWLSVQAQLAPVEIVDLGILVNWGRWERVFCATNGESERYYFVSDRPLCSHCQSAGQSNDEAGLAEVEAYWVDEGGHTDGKTFRVCYECFEAGASDGPGYVLATRPAWQCEACGHGYPPSDAPCTECGACDACCECAGGEDFCATCAGAGCGDCGNSGLEELARQHGCRRGSQS